MAKTDHHLLQVLMDTMPDRIYFKDLEGRFISLNQATRTFHHDVREGAIEGLTDFDLFLPVHAAQARVDELEIIKTGQPMVAKIERERWPDGRVTWVSTSKVPMRDEAGRIVGICGISRDVTEEHLKTEQLIEYTQALAEKQEQTDRELALAREVQQALLPQAFPSFPRGSSEAASALHFAHRYLPEGRVGGDFFTVIPVSDTQAGIFICDVMGHGVHAALVTAVQRVLVEELQVFSGEPGLFLRELNRRLHYFFEPLETAMFVTALYLVVDVATGQVRFANASHPQPLHICREKHSVRVMGSASERHPFALGVTKDSIYTTEQDSVQAGESLLLYTDGLCDLGDEKDMTCDDPRFLNLIENCSKHHGESFLDALLAQTLKLSGGDHFLDDVCLVSVEVERIVPPLADARSSRAQEPATPV